MYKIVFYSRKKMFKPRQYYWRAIHENGRIVAIGGEGYNNKEDCKTSWRRLKIALNGNDFEIIEKY